MISGRRKKWTEAEERSLIEKYGEMVSDGSLSKMKTREKKFKPIASYVNSVHHEQDPIAFPWQWSWKDVSTKVQNMRHQYLLVKQKIKKPPANQADLGGAGDGPEEFDWAEGLTHWSNFPRYKAVFGDLGAPTASSAGELMAATTSGDLGLEIGELGIDGMGLGLEEDEGFVERRRRKRRESEEEEREWEERMRRRRSEWRKRMEKMMSRHQEEMGQMQRRIVEDHQTLTNHLLGMLSQTHPHPPYFHPQNQHDHFILHA